MRLQFVLAALVWSGLVHAQDSSEGNDGEHAGTSTIACCDSHGVCEDAPSLEACADVLASPGRLVTRSPDADDLEKEEQVSGNFRCGVSGRFELETNALSEIVHVEFCDVPEPNSDGNLIIVCAVRSVADCATTSSVLDLVSWPYVASGSLAPGYLSPPLAGNDFWLILSTEGLVQAAERSEVLTCE